jgi:hypothetical protein
MPDDNNQTPIQQNQSKISFQVVSTLANSLRQKTAAEWQQTKSTIGRFQNYLQPGTQAAKTWGQDKYGQAKQRVGDRKKRYLDFKRAYEDSYKLGYQGLEQYRINAILKELDPDNVFYNGDLLDAVAARMQSYKTEARIDKLVHARQALYSSNRYAKMLGVPAWALTSTPLGLIPLPFVYKQLEKVEQTVAHYQYLADFYLNQLPGYTASRYLRKAGMGIGRGALETFGNAFGLTHYTKEIDIYSPSGYSRYATFKPSWIARKRYSDMWRKIADTGELKAFGIRLKQIKKDSHFRVAAAQLARKKRREGAINPLAFIVLDLIGGFLGGALVSFLESKVWGMGALRFARGYLVPTAKAIPSLSSFSGAYLGNRIGESKTGKLLGLDHRVPFAGSLPLNWGTFLGGGGGWYYQTILNMSRNYTTIPLGYLVPEFQVGLKANGQPNIIKSSYYWTPDAVKFRNDTFWRYELNRNSIPRTESLQQRAIVNNALANHTRPVVGEIPSRLMMFNEGKLVPHTELGLQEMQVRVWNEKNLINSKFFNRFFNNPARIMRNPWIRLPIRGLALATLLNVPVSDPLWWTVVLGDYFLQVTKDLAFFKGLERSTFLGAGAGAAAAYVMGGSMATGAAIGAGLGATLNIGTNLARAAFRLTPDKWITITKYGLDSNKNLAEVGRYVVKYPFLPYDIALQDFRYFNISFKGKSFFSGKGLRFLTPSDLFGRFMEGHQQFAEVFSRVGRYLSSIGAGAELGLLVSLFLHLKGINAWWAQPYVLGPVGAVAGGVSRAIFYALGGAGWQGTLSTILKSMWTKITAPISSVFNLFAGADFIGHAIDVASGNVPITSLKDVAGELLRVGLIGIGAALTYIAGPLAFIAYTVGIGAEIFSRIVYHRSLFNLILTRFSYGLAKMGIALGNLVQGLIGFALGFLQAMFARDLNELGGAAATAAISLAMIGTTATTLFIINSGFYTKIEKDILLSQEFAAMDKDVLYKPGASNDQLQYATSFVYKQELDASGNPIPGSMEPPVPPGSITHAKFSDSFDNLNFSDLVSDCNIQFQAEGDNLWEYKCSIEDNRIVLESGNFSLPNLPAGIIPPQTLINAVVTFTLNDKLANVLSKHNTEQLCNVFSGEGDFPSTTKRLNIQRSICIDKNGQKVSPPASLFAQRLVEATREACSQNKYLSGDLACGGASDESCRITSQCLEYNNTGKPDTFTVEGWPVFKDYLETHGFPQAPIANVWTIIYSSTNKYDCLQCVGFVMAHQTGIANGLACPSGTCACAKDFAGDSITHDFTDIADDTTLSKLKIGDLLVFNKYGTNGSDCGHIAVVTQIFGGGSVSIAEAAGSGPNCGTINNDNNIFPLDKIYDLAGYLTLK